MKKRNMSLLLVLFSLVFCTASGTWANTIFYDDFSNGLSDSKWDTTWVDGVAVENGVLTLRDSEYFNTFLFGLPISFGPGNYRFAFDFKTDLASAPSENTLVYDLFTASLAVDTLLEATSQETINYGSEVEQIADGWFHLTYDFTLVQATDLDIWLSLFDNTSLINGTFLQDSTVYLDNFVITNVAQAVPEPSTFALMASIITVVALLRLRRRGGHC